MGLVNSSCFNTEAIQQRRSLCVCVFECLCVCVCVCVCLLESPSPRRCLPRVKWKNRGAESETEPAGIRCDRVSARPSKQM